jgi:hypothetical protein
MRHTGAVAGGIATIVLAGVAYGADYDGTYVGVSAAFTGTTSGGKGNTCSPMTAPHPLTISGGHAQAKWGDGMLTGDVDANGKLVMHSSLSGRFEGQIDASGALKGNYAGYCIYSLSWQRRG